jgi:hypothetical protein
MICFFHGIFGCAKRPGKIGDNTRRISSEAEHAQRRIVQNKTDQCVARLAEFLPNFSENDADLNPSFP